MKENSLSHKMERTAAKVIIENFIKNYKKDNEKALLTLVEYVEKFYGAIAKSGNESGYT